MTPAAARQPDAVWGNGPNVFSLATDSTGELGLLKALTTDFARVNLTFLKQFHGLPRARLEPRNRS